MSDFVGFTKSVARDLRYFPTLISALLLGLLLLFFKELPEPMKQYLVSSLAVYTLGSALLAYVQSMLAWRREFQLKREGREKEFVGNQPLVFALIVLLHVIWFGCLIGYNVYRGVL
jgi:hypothetical protein